MAPFLGGEIPVFVYGLVLGSILLCAGIGFGLWFGRRAHGEAKRPLEAEQLVSFMGGLVEWTSGFANEMAAYRSEISRLRDQMGSAEAPNDPDKAERESRLLEEITRVNEDLQSRLDSAETKLFDQAQEIESYVSEARTDALTGLPNRRVFDDELTRRFAEWRRHGTPLSMIMVDIDHFKMFNDRHGHLAGDEVLRGVAQLIAGTLRESDLVTRFGGEEFGVILPATDRLEACRAAERLREAVELASFVYEGVSLEVTVSCGAGQALEGEAAAALIKRADEGLYASKDAGRNFAHFHDGSRCHPITDPRPGGSAKMSVEPEVYQAVCSELGDRLRNFTQS